MDPHRLLKWYDGLSSRTVDLVGDYAGDELFIIDGDSLLLQVFSDKKLDFSPGFQILHATYLVENFLQKLQKRSCVFKIAFSADNDNLCVPVGTQSQRRHRFLLTREIIIRHLKENIPAGKSAPSVCEFSSYDSEEFASYLHTVGAYFFMCHDGAFSELFLKQCAMDSDDTNASGPEDEPTDEEPSKRDTESINYAAQALQCRLGLRKMIYGFLGHGYNVALINGLEFRDTKIFAMIIERSSSDPRSKRITGQTINLPKDDSGDTTTDLGSSREDNDTLYTVHRDDNVQSQQGHSTQEIPTCTSIETSFDLWQLSSVFDKLRAMSLDFTQRDYLTVAALIIMVESNLIDKSEMGAARAMLLHVVLMRDCKLADRAIRTVQEFEQGSFLNNFASLSHTILKSAAWQNFVSCSQARFDLHDLLDGRLFLFLASKMSTHTATETLSPYIWSEFTELCSKLSVLVDFGLSNADPVPNAISSKSKKTATKKSKGGKQSQSNKEPQEIIKSADSVLPFKNYVFDVHLRPVHLSIDDSVDESTESGPSKTFQELSHWHNSKRPLDEKSDPRLDLRTKMLLMRRNDFFMAEMRDYAASLTNATGAMLEPETVLVKSAKDSKKKSKHLASSSNGTAPTTEPPKKKVQKQGRSSVRKDALKSKLAKHAEAREKSLKQWSFTRGNIDREANLVKRFTKAKSHLLGLAKDQRVFLAPEILVYQLDTLVKLLLENIKGQQEHSNSTLLSFIWETVRQISRLQGPLPSDAVAYVTKISRLLGLPSVEIQSASDQRLSFQCAQLSKKDLEVAKVSSSSVEFQLSHAGPFMERDVDARPDSRVHDFEPDRWQRDVLDQIDAKRSIFVVAPTSSGKTFISFYAMKQVLEEDNDGVLIYVAPTKALVNQIAAEVQARFSKRYPYSGKSVWAIHTRDYRINNSSGCQVLITVPHILQIMLLAPSNANSWSSRVKRIIFDEVHCIGQADDGVVWEQLLLMAPCPIIALSATVGNPQEFCEWLAMTQKATGTELKMIEHKQRYSDLRKFVHDPPDNFAFGGFSEPKRISPLGLDETPGMRFVHPVSSLFDRSRGIPEDLSLEPRDCLTLWKAMKKHECPGFILDSSMDPNARLPHVVRKADVAEWQSVLKDTLRIWMANKASPLEKVLEELSETPAQKPESNEFTSMKVPNESTSVTPITRNDILETTLPLVCALHDQQALPALFFNYDRSRCEGICRKLLHEFETAEEKWKQTSSTWKNKLGKWNEMKEAQAKLAKKRPPKPSKKSQESEELSRAEREQEAALNEANPLNSFDPNAPVDGFHVANTKTLLASEFAEYAEQLRRRDVPDWLIKALRRGIGVHHAGMNRKYRQVCEMLFRKGYLRVVIATGTLALGINMPCKTVVFSGDSVFLTALNYRQAAGRAGRRGFDVLGNVVFQNIPETKVQRLMSSQLPRLSGHFPITTSLVLRLCILLHESKNAPYAVKAINSILSCPRIYLGGQEMKDAVLHHLRFSIEYLRRNHLLARNGAPLNYAASISHLYYTEKSSFAFHALLNAGFFHELCTQLGRQRKATLRELMLVLSHLFGRLPIRQANLENIKDKTRKSTSVVLLPPMPSKAAKILKKHDKATLKVYTAYVSTFIEQHVLEPDRTLPFSKISCGGEKSSSDLIPVLATSAKKILITSPFYALSGNSDQVKSISDLCQTVRSGVWLEEAVVPYVDVSPEGEAPLNAYLYDFFKHGNVSALQRENGIRRGDMWFLLNDFSLVLATIVTSLENFLKLTPGTEIEMLDLMGEGESHDLHLDDADIEINEKITLPERPAKKQPPKAISVTSATVTRGKVKSNAVADNWDDDLSDTPSEAEEPQPQAKQKKKKKKAAQHESKQSAESSGKFTPSPSARNDDHRILAVLKAFKLLQKEFNNNFKAFWA
ncbi:Uncharacterized protein PECH_006191 [Penicillium ucsense]|uniref:P-loop containing nucleoside triphosphate hydrolase protein n=1 Tax=Penicillium ucsense TaxID=2839758 RepID=A0A8J8W1T4_9EURO|nr:Uncharacterized protein PECM_006515 [Penicillium ucsense]KAF7735724.1 Uncharacterized protein PECH_006191 [Penicillium ucsense]